LRTKIGLAALVGVAVIIASPLAKAQQADPDATLRVTYAGAPGSLDPHKPKSTGDFPYVVFVYDRLTRIADDLSVHPMLATSWQATPDGKALELKLRTDVVFHDGTKFDAAAVKASLERAKSVGSDVIKGPLRGIASIEVVDPSTVRLVLASGGAELPGVLGTTVGAMISPKAIASGADLATNPGDAGSGPFMIKDFRLNERVTYERAPTYWGPNASSRPKIVELNYVAQGATRINGLKSGQFDVAFISGPDVAQSLKESEAGLYRARQVFVATQHAIMLQPARAIWQDERVRRAVALAIDRESISKDFLAGNCKPASEPLMKENPAYNPATEDLVKYDPAKARALLKEAGVSNLSFEASAIAGSSMAALAPVLQAQLKEVGIDMKVSPRPGFESTGAFRAGQVDALVNPYTGQADVSLTLANHFLGGDKLIDPKNTELKAIAEKALNPALQPAERNKLYQEAMLMVVKEGYGISICNTRQLQIYTDKVIGVDKMDWTWAGLPDYSTLAKSK